MDGDWLSFRTPNVRQQTGARAVKKRERRMRKFGPGPRRPSGCPGGPGRPLRYAESRTGGTTCRAARLAAPTGRTDSGWDRRSLRDPDPQCPAESAIVLQRASLALIARPVCPSSNGPARRRMGQRRRPCPALLVGLHFLVEHVFRPARLARPARRIRVAVKGEL
jgi:hypothetical protein